VHLIDRSMDEDDTQIIEGVLPDLYDDPTDVPAVVVVASAKSASSLTGAYLSGLRGRGVEVVAPSVEGDVACSNSRPTMRKR